LSREVDDQSDNVSYFSPTTGVAGVARTMSNRRVEKSTPGNEGCTGNPLVLALCHDDGRCYQSLLDDGGQSPWRVERGQTRKNKPNRTKVFPFSEIPSNDEKQTQCCYA